MTQILFYLTLILLPLSTRQFIESVIPGIHEYEALFVYASDLVILLFLMRVLFTSHHSSHYIHEPSFRKLFPPLYIFIFCALVSMYVAPSYALGVYGFIRLVILAAFALSVPIVMRAPGVFNKTLAIIAGLAILQAGVGIYQFSQQASAGLGVLGEPQLVSYGGHTSTVAAEGGRVIRSYGTFPHPNIYGGFLVLGLVSLAYLYLLFDAELYKWRATRTVYDNFKLFIFSRYFFFRLAIAVGLFIVLFGLLTSLSRGAWLGAAAAMLVMAGVGLWRGYYRPVFRLLVVAGLACTVLVYILNPVLAPRSQLSIGQPAVDYRLTYTRLAGRLVSHHPFGVGIANQVLYSVESGTFRSFGLHRVWEWEPIHNLYLLIGSEIGLMGLLSFLAFLAIVLWHGLRHSADLAEIAVLALLVGVLTLGMFDHYLWTIQPGRLMLWLAIGLALSHFSVRQVWFIKEKR